MSKVKLEDYKWILRYPQLPGLENQYLHVDRDGKMSPGPRDGAKRFLERETRVYQSSGLEPVLFEPVPKHPIQLMSESCFLVSGEPYDGQKVLMVQCSDISVFMLAIFQMVMQAPSDTRTVELLKTVNMVEVMISAWAGARIGHVCRLNDTGSSGEWQIVFTTIPWSSP